MRTDLLVRRVVARYLEANPTMCGQQMLRDLLEEGKLEDVEEDTRHDEVLRLIQRVSKEQYPWEKAALGMNPPSGMS